MSIPDATGLTSKMQMVVVALSASTTTVTMPVAGNTQPYGYLHGGASAALAETAASLAANEHAARRGAMAVGTNLSISHLRPAKEGFVTAHAEADHLGNTSTVHSVRILDSKGRLIAVASVTNRLVAKD